MVLVYGILAALCIGISDFSASIASRTRSPVAVTRTNMFVSGLLGPLLLLVKPWEWVGADVVVGVMSGMAMALGLQLLYRGYVTARMSVVAPVSSVVFGVVPVLWGAMTGELPGIWVVAGMAVAVAALAPTTWTPGGEGSVRTALMLGLGSGALFAVAFVLMSELSEQSGLLPLWAQRVAGFTVLACVQPFEKSPLIVLAMPARPWAWAAGVCSFVGLASLQLGYALPGSDAVASVAVAQFAPVLVVLSFIFNGDRLRWWQSLGVLASGIGVGIMAGAA
jgi:drug/metabolite transporter (DMT)-like permease